MIDDKEPWQDDPRKHPKLFVIFVLIIIAAWIAFPDAATWFGGE